MHVLSVIELQSEKILLYIYTALSVHNFMETACLLVLLFF